MKLKSSRIYLRPLRRSDAKALFDAVDSSRNELDRFMIWSPRTTRVKDSAVFIKQTFTWRRNGTTFAFGIFDSQTDGYIGNVGLHDIRRSINSAEIGYWIRSSWTGKGIATESSAIVLKFAFEELRTHRVILRAADDNLASIRVAEKLGFRLDGMQRHELHLSRGWLDFQCFSILDSEYHALKSKIDSFITR